MQEAAPEKTDFDLILKEVPKEKKIAVIKAIRSITGLGLKEAKGLADNPGKIIEGKPKEACEDAKKQLEEAGAKAEIESIALVRTMDLRLAGMARRGHVLLSFLAAVALWLQIPSDEPSFVNGLTARGAELQCRAVVLVLLSRAQQRTQSKKKIMLTNTEPEAHGILPQAVSPVPAKAIISGVGPGLGQGLAGTMGPAWGWQAPFACVGVCGFSLSLLLFGYLREPPGMDKVEDAGDRNQLCGTWVRDLRIPTVVLICLQGITGCVPWAVINTFLTDYLAQNGGLGVLRATGVFLSFGIGCTTGTVLGGKLGQFLYKKDGDMAWC
eukprot:g20738.t1